MTKTKEIIEKVFDKMKLILVGIFGFVVLLSFFFAGLYFIEDEDYCDEYWEEDYQDEDYADTSGCNVSGIEFRGDLVTYVFEENKDEDGYAMYDEISSEEIVYYINDANEDNDIKAILIEVDSYGGSPAAAEEINYAVKNSEKPVIVHIREGGLSGAYWAISGADKIFSLMNSDIGSIGVTISYLDYAQYNSKEGINYNQLSTGKFKDMFSEDKALTTEEKRLIMRDLDIVNEIFMKTVAENRGIDLEEVKKMADGSSMLGEMAKKNGLIDEVGSFYDVKDYLKEVIGEDVEICW